MENDRNKKTIFLKKIEKYFFFYKNPPLDIK